MRREKLMVVGLGLICGIAALMTGLPLQAATPESPLVRLHADLKFMEVKSSLSGEDLFVTRPGTISGDAVFLPDLSTFWVSSANLGHLDASQMSVLGTSLGEAQVGVQGGCEIAGSIDNTLGWTGAYTLTWWGMGNRSHSFTVDLVNFPASQPECPAGVQDLIRVIEKLSSETLGLSAYSPFSD